MANWFDFISLTLTIGVVGGVIYSILYTSKRISQSVQSTKESLKTRGLTISDKGVSIKTSKRFDREDYVDATQRGFVKAMGAASFRKGDGPVNAVSHTPPVMHRSGSVASSKSNGSVEEKKKKGLFRKNHSGSKDKI
ncbi:hypothetical protein BDZ94DRAFT_1319254 [Collybia nuda]|uniref:Uncharacterized protein n=1 Tax=Collybia nuda TaxID=64659 RepID=A0A9P5YDM6_9AGAR|nr:hypothetical protein BDZ94DRAFT_1319254 [Collybia nuda]